MIINDIPEDAIILKRYDAVCTKFNGSTFSEILREVVRFISIYIAHQRGVLSKESFDIWFNDESLSQIELCNEQGTYIIALLSIIYPQSIFKKLGVDDK